MFISMVPNNKIEYSPLSGVCYIKVSSIVDHQAVI